MDNNSNLHIQKITVNSVKTRHQELILHTILLNETISRTKIAKKLAISNTTVGTIIDKYLTSGVLVEKDISSNILGRKPKLLQINNNNFFILLIDLCNENELSFTLLDILGNFLTKNTLKIDSKKRTAYKTTFTTLLEQAKVIISEKYANVHLEGICVSIPGIYQKQTDTVSSCTNTHLYKISIAATIKDYFDTQITVQNDISLATYSYIATGDYEVANTVFIYITKGIGSSIIIDGKLYRGACGHAGEIGQTLIAPNTTLEQKANAQLFYQKVQEHYSTKTQEESVKIAVEKYYKNDTFICNLVTEVQDILSVSLSNLILTNNPKVIYILGEYNPLGYKFINELSQKIYFNIPQMLHECVEIRFANNDNFNLNVGASHILLKKWIKRISLD